MNFFGNFVKQIVQNTFNSSNQFDCILISQASINDGSYVCVRKNTDETIFLYKEQNTNIHVCVKLKNGKVYSVFRDRNPTVVDENYERFNEPDFRFLFSILETEEHLKEIIQQIHSKPKWSVVHLVCALGYDRYFQYKSADPNTLLQINTPALPDGSFPLHIAIQNGHASLINRLLSLGADVSTVDTNGMNSLHYAALSDEKTIKALEKAPRCRDCINNENDCGFTPLYLSINNYKPDNVRALLDAGASATVPCLGKTMLFHLLTSGQTNAKFQDCMKILIEKCPAVLNETDINTGDSVFHIASESQILSTLLRSCAPNTNLDVRNGAGETPLMSFLNRANLDCFIKMLSFGADIEARDIEGNTCLHLAVMKSFVKFVQTLLIFNADTSNVNRNGDTPLHLAAKSGSVAKNEILRCFDVVSAPRCPPGKIGCTDRCIYRHVPPQVKQLSDPSLNDLAQTFAISATLEKKRQGKRLENLLTLDGGGVRGLVLLQILLCVEKRLNGASILSKFHWVAGTSTGAIVAAALCAGRTLKECQRLYFRFKDDVFGSGSRPYDTNILENFLKFEIGAHKTMADVKNCKLVLTSVDGNVLPLKLYMIRSYQLPLESVLERRRFGYEDPSVWPLWKAARCSSAAPTYFTAVDDKYIDGGLVANNPTLDLFVEVHNYNMALKLNNMNDKVSEIGCVLSVGTGKMPESSMSTLRLSQPTGVIEALAAAFSFKDLGKLLIEQVTESEGRPVDRSRAVFHSTGIPYFRFSTPLSREVILDETRNEILIDALWQTLEYVHKFNNQFDSLVELLL